MSHYAIDVGDTDFQDKVLTASHTLPVLVDFWASWCGPCQVLKPMLEKLAEEYDGRFLLAKVNSDENPGLSRQFGIRSIPTVAAIINGQIIDQFSGALPERELRAFIDRLLPSEAELIRREAQALLEKGDTQGAQARLEAALALDRTAIAAQLDLIELLLGLGDVDSAGAMLTEVPLAQQTDERYQRLAAKHKALQGGGKVADVGWLEELVAERPDDAQVRFDLAMHYLANERYEPALAHLLVIVQRDRQFGDDAARKAMLDAFRLCPDSALVSDYRRRLASALN